MLPHSMPEHTQALPRAKVGQPWPAIRRREMPIRLPNGPDKLAVLTKPWSGVEVSRPGIARRAHDLGDCQKTCCDCQVSRSETGKPSPDKPDSMPRFAANISLMFEELPYLERFAAAADAGFDAVEILNPYETAAKDTQRALIANGLNLVLINAPPPNYTGGTRGFAAISDGTARFQSDIRRVLRYCEILRPTMIHVMSGVAEGPAARDALIANLQWAADLAPDQMFTIEPLNPKDQPGYFLNNYPLAIEVLDAVERPNVGLQYDAYHAHLIHGDAASVWEEYGPRAVHIQIGNPPDRSPPGTDGPLDFAALFASIDASGYDGWVSGEYHPGGPTEKTLGWMHASTD